MAKNIITEVLDDMDQTAGAETYRFSVEGVDYEIDLAEKNSQKFMKAVQPFMAVARVVEAPKAKTASAKNPEVAKIREWAKSAGVEVNARGRISKEVQEAYHAATAKA